MAAARVDVLRTRLSFTRITAPVDGVVTARHVEVGNLAAPRSPLLEMAAGSGLLLRLPVSELDVVKLAPGDRVEVRVDAMPQLVLAGRIARIFPAAESASRQVTVEVALTNVPPGVRPGFLARAALVLERRENALLIPEAAVLRGAEVPFFVWVVEQDRVTVRPVRVAARLSGRALVEAGLQPGDEVVVEGFGRVRDGAVIQRMGTGGGS
jgi:membrane fusion protein (multidrug efflux system)